MNCYIVIRLLITLTILITGLCAGSQDNLFSKSNRSNEKSSSKKQPTYMLPTFSSQHRIRYPNVIEDSHSSQNILELSGRSQEKSNIQKSRNSGTKTSDKIKEYEKPLAKGKVEKVQKIEIPEQKSKSIEREKNIKVEKPVMKTKNEGIKIKANKIMNQSVKPDILNESQERIEDKSTEKARIAKMERGRVAKAREAIVKEKKEESKSQRKSIEVVKQNRSLRDISNEAKEQITAKAKEKASKERENAAKVREEIAKARKEEIEAKRRAIAEMKRNVNHKDLSNKGREKIVRSPEGAENSRTRNIKAANQLNITRKNLSVEKEKTKRSSIAEKDRSDKPKEDIAKRRQDNIEVKRAANQPMEPDVNSKKIYETPSFIYHKTSTEASDEISSDAKNQDEQAQKKDIQDKSKTVHENLSKQNMNQGTTSREATEIEMTKRASLKETRDQIKENKEAGKTNNQRAGLKETRDESKENKEVDKEINQRNNSMKDKDGISSEVKVRAPRKRIESSRQRVDIIKASIDATERNKRSLETNIHTETSTERRQRVSDEIKEKAAKERERSAKAREEIMRARKEETEAKRKAVEARRKQAKIKKKDVTPKIESENNPYVMNT